MIRKTALALVIVLNLAVCGAFAAAQAGTTTAKSKTTKASAAPASQEKLSPIRVTSGTITTVADSKMVISHKVNGKTAEATFALNSDTKREGDLAVGSRVTVRYRMQGGENIATMVKGKKSGHKA